MNLIEGVEKRTGYNKLDIEETINNAQCEGDRVMRNILRCHGKDGNNRLCGKKYFGLLCFGRGIEYQCQNGNERDQ